jgi:DNA-binding NtrC family response regulator
MAYGLVSTGQELNTMQADLPATPEMAGKPGSKESTDATAHADHSILVVDDVTDVLVTVGAFLTREGFTVQRAANGDEALRLIASDPTIDVLVTDFAMPGLSGVELIAQAVQIRPNIKALVITGYPNADGLAELPPLTTILVKPFRRYTLIDRIQSLLGETQLPRDQIAELTDTRELETVAALPFRTLNGMASALPDK